MSNPLKPNLDHYRYPLQVPTMWAPPRVEFVISHRNETHLSMRTVRPKCQHVCTMVEGYIIAVMGQSEPEHYYPS
jgi:hypothetical protein